MRNRGIKKQFWCNTEEALELQKKSIKCKMSEAEVIRKLIMDTELREKPDNRFYEVMKQLRAIGNNLNQIVKKANSTNYINTDKLYSESVKWNKFINDIRSEFLVSRRK